MRALNLGVMASLGPEQSWPRIRDAIGGAGDG